METTVKGRLYFGVTLDDFQAARFIMTEVFDITPSLLASCEEQATTREQPAGGAAPDQRRPDRGT